VCKPLRWPPAAVWHCWGPGRGPACKSGIKEFMALAPSTRPGLAGVVPNAELFSAAVRGGMAWRCSSSHVPRSSVRRPHTQRAGMRRDVRGLS
jgi:hypothetical protein